MFIKTFNSLWLLVLLLVADLAACGGANEDDETQSPTATPVALDSDEAFDLDDAYKIEATNLKMTANNLSTLKKGCLGSGGYLQWIWTNPPCPNGYYGGSSLDASYKKAYYLAAGYNGTQLADNAGGYWGECVSMIKSLSKNNTATAGWIRGANVVSAGNIAVGTGIALFSNNGKFLSGSDHAAFLAGYIKDGNGKITSLQVWDQNWGARAIQFHSISVTGNGVADADKYYVIQVP